MNTKINKSFKSKVITLISAALVISFFAIPTVGILSSKDEIIESENRKMYEFPEFSFKKKAYKSFLEGVSRFLEDRLLFRFSFNAVSEPVYNQHFYRGAEKTQHGIAIKGLQNWLFYSPDYYYEQHIKEVPFNTQRQKFIVNSLKNAQSLAGGVPLYVIVCPDKLAIYPEKAVPWIGHPGKYRLANKKIEFMQEQGLTVLDNYALLKEHKKDGILYYLGDTHWNQYAAYLAFNSNMETILGKDFVKKPYKYSWSIRKSGDLGYGFGGYENSTEYDCASFSLENADDISVKAYKTIDKPYFEGAKKELSDVNIPNYNWADDAIETINLNAPIKKTVVIYSDSFYHAGYKIFCEGLFEHIITIHHNTLIERKPLAQDIITKFKPDLILYECVERDL